MSFIELSPAIPQLPSGNIDETALFFEKFLGFQNIALIKEHKLLIVKRGQAEIHFWEAESPETARKIGIQSSCYVRVKSIETLFNELKTRKVTFRYELKEMPWGMREMQIDDPFGNAIKFGEPV